jgi:hypothetical protein
VLNVCWATTRESTDVIKWIFTPAIITIFIHRHNSQNLTKQSGFNSVFRCSTRLFTGYRLLLRWYRTKRPIHCGYFLIYSASPSEFELFLIHLSELCGKHQQSPSSEVGRNLARNVYYLFRRTISVILRRDIQHDVKSDDMVTMALLPLRRKSCYGFLSPLKIHRPQPGLNP